MILKYSIIIAINLLSYLLTYKISKLSKNHENKIVSKILIILSIVYVIVDALLSWWIGRNKKLNYKLLFTNIFCFLQVNK